MCFYITSTLPKNIKLEGLKGLFQEYDMSYEPVKNQAIQDQLRPDELYFRATNAYCDCDTILGALNTSEDYKKLLNSQKVRNLRKKKWTSEQIDNWISEKIKGNNPKFDRLTDIEKENKIKRWIDFINAILASDQVKRIGILKHWYNAGLSNEEFTIRETKQIQIDQLNKNLLLNLEEDILYEFIPIYKY
jgi:hypothetical protein